MKLSKEFIRDASIWIFLTTIISYGLVIFYQKTYLEQFGINSIVLKLTIDPAALLQAVFLMFLIFGTGIAVYVYTHFANLAAYLGGRIPY